MFEESFFGCALFIFFIFLFIFFLYIYFLIFWRGGGGGDVPYISRFGRAGDFSIE